MQMLETPVAIVGGGPVGLALALFLDFYGVESVVFNAGETTRWHPKGSTHNARTMEHYRRLGLSQQIRQIGLPEDHPTDVAYFTRYGSHELARCRMPSTREKLAAVARSSSLDQVPEPIHRGNQMYVERFLLQQATACARITLRFGCAVTEVSDRDDHVLLRTRTQDGETGICQARYVVGCDGGRSFVRKSLGIRYGGFDSLKQDFLGGAMLSSYIRSPGLYQRHLGARKAWHYWALNNETRSILTTLNGADEFLLMTKITGGETLDGPAEVAARIRKAAGDPDLDVEVISQEPWTAGAALVADSFGRGRVFLAGDAVHLFTPTGGFGMNTGIDDAANLSWKLAAMIAGWGGDGLLESYEAERRPIALRNTNAAREFARSVGSIDLSSAIENDGPDGQAARQSAGAVIDGFGEEYASLGVQLGARYDASPIIARDHEAPADDPITYRPSSVAGGRAPHFWLSESRTSEASLFDRLGKGFTLLSFVGHGKAVSAFQDAARRCDLPLDILTVDHPDARALYGVDFALTRPDQHIAWSGSAAPDDLSALLARISGRRQKTQATQPAPVSVDA